MEENKNETPIKKGNGGVKAIVAIIIIAILAGVAYYFLKPTAPKDVFVAGINSALEKSSQKLGKNVDKINATITLSGNIESNDEEVKQIASYINDGKLTYNVQVDRSAKKVAMSANIDYKNENLLNGKLYYADGDDNIYFYVQDLFDKYFKFNLKESVKDEEELASIKEMFEGSSSSKIDFKKASSIVKNEITKNLKDEYFSKEKVEGTTKNTMKLTVAEFKNVVKSIVTSLKNNEEFLKCFEKSEELKEGLEEILEGIDEIDSDYDSKNVEFSIYTKGMKNEVEKFEAKIPATQTDDMVLTIVETENNKFEITVDAAKLGKITLNMEVKNEKDTDLNNIDVSDSVDINNMTQADMIKLYGNLMNMKIYQYIAPLLMGGM